MDPVDYSKESLLPLAATLSRKRKTRCYFLQNRHHFNQFSILDFCYRLFRCRITSKGCVSLAEALKLNPSHLQELDLTRNDLSDEGVEILSKGLASPHCILKILKLHNCGITHKGCVSLAETLKLNPSHLQELDLSENHVSNDGVEILSKGLASPNCILKVLK
ncbi:ribonuclease inhibitor-like [Corythoichthys intestinalis]|uniref:ribonuclease inhibitor-like n=1 Tax=Corythoichthys intestinalis TaxID=161448 RepID=UPI0025A527E1|nr:ribonuclease inhibitor-like [Corythoichthys intestinalis]